SSSHMLGNLLALGISIVGALFNLACLPLIKRYSALRVSAWYIMFGSLFMAPLTFRSWDQVDWGALSAGSYIAVIYNVFFCTIFAFVVWNASMHKVGAAHSSFFRYVTPAAAMIAGYFFFGETVSIWQGVGSIFMAAGLIWITLDHKKDAPVDTAA
ncbi:MAG: DMT family transporter, partial [Paenibacillus sp.]|nr:DMT family transporter [Paenibacillus sp.]